MRRILSGLMLLLCLQGLAGPRIALVGVGQSGENFADLVLAESGGLEFVERSEIQNVLKERKLLAQNLDANSIPGLSGLLRVAVFAIIEGDPGEMLRVTVFETANGFRLAELLLPPEEAKPEQVAAELRRAIGLLQNPQNATFLSFGGVTDLGVPERYAKEARACAAAVRRRITAIPGIIILERDHLSRLRAERRLTGEFGRLAGAARMVRFQLIPGAAAEQNSCRLQLIDTDGTVLLEQTCSVTDSAAPKTLAAKVAEFLKKSPPPAETPQDREKEAARFFAAARLRFKTGQGNTPDTLRLSRIAVELSPTQEHRKTLMASALDNLCQAGAPAIGISELTDIIELLNPRETDTGDEILRNLCEIQSFLLQTIYLRRIELDEAQLETVRHTAVRIREDRIRELDIMRKPMEGWDDFSRLSYFLYKSFELVNPCFWFDDRNFPAGVQPILEQAGTLLIAAMKRPAPPKIEKDDLRSLLCAAHMMLNRLPGPLVPAATERLAAAAETANQPYLREFAVQIRFHAALLGAGTNQQRITQACRTARLRAMPDDDYATCMETIYSVRELEGRKRIDYHGMFRKTGGNTGAAAPVAKKKAPPKPAFRQEEIALPGNYPILHTDMTPQGKFYFTLIRGNGLTLHQLDPASKKVERLNYFADNNMNSLLQPAAIPTRMQISEGFAAISREDRIDLLPLDGSKALQIGDWPGKIAGAVVFHGRVWTVGPLLLASAGLDGKNRTVHFSWLEEGKNGSDAVRDQVNGSETFRNLYPEPETGCLLLLTQYRILRFHPDSGKLEACGRFVDNGSHRLVPPEKAGRDVPPGPICMCRGLLWEEETPNHPGRAANPSEPEKQAYAEFPDARAFYPHPDGHSVLMVTKNRIVKVTPPEKLP